MVCLMLLDIQNNGASDAFFFLMLKNPLTLKASLNKRVIEK